MITAVVDTNVLASGFVRSDRPPGQLLAAWQAGSYALVVSNHVLTELARTFEEPYFVARLTPQQRANNLDLVRDEATVTPVTVEVRGIATHPEDDVVLATAVSARADYLVTGDTRLQRLGTYEDVRIVSPRELVQLLDGRS